MSDTGLVLLSFILVLLSFRNQTTHFCAIAKRCVNGRTARPFQWLVIWIHFGGRSRFKSKRPALCQSKPQGEDEVNKNFVQLHKNLLAVRFLALAAPSPPFQFSNLRLQVA